MTTNQLIASLVGSMAWPAAVVLIAVVFRRSIRQLLVGHLRRLKAGPFEADFDLIASQVEAQVDQPIAAVGEPQERTMRIRDAAGRSSAAVVIEAYGEVEQQLRSLLTENDAGHDDDMPRSAAGLARLAGSKGIIRPETVNAVEGLTVYRNLAAHRDAITEEKAEEYLRLVDGVSFAIRQNARSYESRAAVQN